MPAWLVILIIGIVVWMAIIAYNCYSIWYSFHSGEWRGPRRELKYFAFFALFGHLAYLMRWAMWQTTLTRVILCTVIIITSCAFTLGGMWIKDRYGDPTAFTWVMLWASLLLPLWVEARRHTALLQEREDLQQFS